MHRFFFILIVIFFMALPVHGQEVFSVPEVYYQWNELQRPQVSHSGSVVTYEVNRLRGDGFFHILVPQKDHSHSVARGRNGRISPAEDFTAFLIKPAHDSLRELELLGVSRRMYPKDTLGIYHIDKQQLEKIARIRSFRVPQEEANWLAWLHEEQEKEPEKEKNDTLNNQEEEPDKPQNDTAKTPSVKGRQLVAYHPETEYRMAMDQVDNYRFSRNGKLLLFTRTIEPDDNNDDNDERDSVQVWTFCTNEQQKEMVFAGRGDLRRITTDREGRSFAFLFSSDTAQDNKHYGLYLNGDMIADSSASFLPPGWYISPHGSLRFCEKGDRLLFGTAPFPEPEREDTLTQEEKFSVDIWHWQDKQLQPRQKLHQSREETRTYTAYYTLRNNQFTQVEDKELKQIHILKGNTSNRAFSFCSEPYERKRTWTGRSYRDIYAIDLSSGQRKRILEKHANRRSFSPGGRYLAYYNEKDSCWYAMDLRRERITNLTASIQVPFYDTQDDRPRETTALRAAGWDQNNNVYLYDEYDIWKMDARGRREPKNLTGGYGRENNMRFRYLKTDPDLHYLPKKLLLTVFNKETMESGYAKVNTEAPKKPQILYMGPFRTYGLQKAQDTSIYVFRQSTFRDYPNLWLTDSAFREPQKMSDANPQQKNYAWGTAHSTQWTSGNGDTLSGIIYKPDNFDPNKKYPMIVYFYERYSHLLHRHYTPRPSHSSINFTRYVNDGYIIFIPDIVYQTGYPGRSAENAVISGTLHLLGKGYVDANRIGIQGQSWGGYQVAHLITRTNLFSAAMAGAPVANMTSAYGQMRWSSGLNRAFQYEQTQSRIGGTLWEKPVHYIENSPLFHVPDITTPLLIMHNDDDGAVPWEQGIELFNAMRRLDKVCYMLVYNDDKHNLRHWGNRMDLSIRMKQFFDHYLKDKPMPKWMSHGIPATKKGRTTGYEPKEK